MGRGGASRKLRKESLRGGDETAGVVRERVATYLLRREERLVEFVALGADAAFWGSWKVDRSARAVCGSDGPRRAAGGGGQWEEARVIRAEKQTC